MTTSLTLGVTNVIFVLTNGSTRLAESERGLPLRKYIVTYVLRSLQRVLRRSASIGNPRLTEWRTACLGKGFLNLTGKWRLIVSLAVQHLTSLLAPPFYYRWMYSEPSIAGPDFSGAASKVAPSPSGADGSTISHTDFRRASSPRASFILMVHTWYYYYPPGLGVKP